MKFMKKMGNALVALAVLAAPMASGFCRTFFYEEEEPEETMNSSDGKKRTYKGVWSPDNISGFGEP